jgi:hypothetical protein
VLLVTSSNSTWWPTGVLRTVLCFWLPAVIALGGLQAYSGRFCAFAVPSLGSILYRAKVLKVVHHTTMQNSISTNRSARSPVISVSDINWKISHI